MLSKVCTSFVNIPLQKVLVNVIKFQNVRNVHKNHYQVLGLLKNCSTKDIRDAFVKLSKTYHPDVNKNNLAHHQFLKVSEAYNVLSKPISRKIYDVELNHYSLYGNLRSNKNRSRPKRYNYESSAYWNPKQTCQDPFHEKQNCYNQASKNKMASLMCLFFSLVGIMISYYHIIFIIQFCAIRNSAKRDFLLTRSLENKT